jgi:hypothetical protein
VGDIGRTNLTNEAMAALAASDRLEKQSRVTQEKGAASVGCKGKELDKH